MSEQAKEIVQLRAALAWALQEISDRSRSFDFNGTPSHDCEFVTNPPAGGCTWHERYWNAYKLAYPHAYDAEPDFEKIARSDHDAAV